MLFLCRPMCNRILLCDTVEKNDECFALHILSKHSISFYADYQCIPVSLCLIPCNIIKMHCLGFSPLQH